MPTGGADGRGWGMAPYVCSSRLVGLLARPGRLASALSLLLPLCHHLSVVAAGAIRIGCVRRRRAFAFPVFPPRRWLQRLHMMRTLSMVSCPPFAHSIMWSASALLGCLLMS